MRRRVSRRCGGSVFGTAALCDRTYPAYGMGGKRLTHFRHSGRSAEVHRAANLKAKGSSKAQAGEWTPALRPG
ncbi:hypothetical protein SPHINGOAX6_40108 [Sphingomonas sp. AX6]|nr:hypothetical protein SPHINGOAX6_40108 [Sphingomonas sp. AX6]